MSATTPLIYPAPGPERIVITDNQIRTRTVIQNFAYFGAYFINWVQAAIISWYLAVLIQYTTSEFTYYRGGTTTCERYYDWDTHASRWLFFAFAGNLFDIYNCFNIGQKFWGKFSLSTIAFFLYNAAIAVTAYFSFAIGCNGEGNGDTGNICNDGRFCGVLDNIQEVANNCLHLNPTDLPVWPPLDNTKLQKDGVYVQFMAYVILFMVANLIKFACIWVVPSSTALLKDTANYVKDAVKSIKENELPRDFPSEEAPKPVKKRNMFSNLDFFTLYKDSQIMFYIPVEFFIAFLGVGCVIMFGWFGQNVKNFVRTFTVSTLHPGYSEYSVVTTPAQWENAIMHMILFGVVIGWFCQSRLGNMTTNWIAIVGSIIGFICVSIVIAWSLFAVYPNCNLPGKPYNICKNPEFCSSYSGVNGTQAQYENPANLCQSYACPIQIPTNTLTVNENYLVLNLFMGLALVTFIQTTIYGIVIQIRLSNYIGKREDTDQANDEALQNGLTTNVVPDDVPDRAIEEYANIQKQNVIAQYTQYPMGYPQYGSMNMYGGGYGGVGPASGGVQLRPGHVPIEEDDCMDDSDAYFSDDDDHEKRD